MKARPSLRRSILLGLFAYAALLSVALGIEGVVVNEHVERLVWQTLLKTEMDHFLQRRQEPGYRWADTSAISLRDATAHPEGLPEALRALGPGLHDDIEIDGSERVVMVRDVDGHRLVLSLDIGELETRELDMGLTIAGLAITMIALLALVIAWGVNRLLQPLSSMATRIGHLQPDRFEQRIDIPEPASAELFVIATALNDYLERNARFVERERAFLDSTSHELRTPIAVIVGATELGLEHADQPDVVRKQLSRIHRTARDVEELISLLLVLAKDPARLASSSDRVPLDQLLPQIVHDHQHLTQDKDLNVTITSLAPAEVIAPVLIVQAAIGNLLRNAIENSDRGDIRISLRSDATVVIEDPGHGMTPEEISTIYARIARGSGREGGGIGLDLIARLCEHLGWTLDIASATGRGTTTTLQLRPRDVSPHQITL